ncbi:hypothetical protein D9Q98_010574 [Chlorella vulgaris]|uniref:Uncharacterized protein n=1 Tax=Chlorella vulgaris TaxID=3077 RepID=A0A9D4TEF9_CHLVU|nr:hypothetical protein D9Q98_010677 [Chlorella vulgaris]KAI3431821.1 hypothetical protein D9Q98_010574 [Chlorella vulgaris]
MGLWRALLKLKKVMERPFLLPDKFRYAQEFKGWVLGAKLDRQRAAAARRYGDAAIAAERLAVVAQTTAVGGLLRIMLPAYGVPLDLVAGLEAAIETSRLQEGELFDRIVRGLLTFIDLSEQTDEAEQRLMAYDTQDWTKMTFGKLIIDGVCYFVWMTAGVGLLSRWLCKIGLNPYWPAMSFALTFIVWLSALAWKLGQWAWVVPIVGGLIGWKFNHSKDIVRAMKEDAKQLSGLLDALFTDAEVLPAQLRDLLQLVGKERLRLSRRCLALAGAMAEQEGQGQPQQQYRMYELYQAGATPVCL